MNFEENINYEMAHADNPEEIIMATQRSLLSSMRDVIGHIKKDLKTQGLTWDQIEYMIKGFENKKPKIVMQKEEI